MIPVIGLDVAGANTKLGVPHARGEHARPCPAGCLRDLSFAQNFPRRLPRQTERHSSAGTSSQGGRGSALVACPWRCSLQWTASPSPSAEPVMRTRAMSLVAAQRAV
jgi:hypothetical protein